MGETCDKSDKGKMKNTRREREREREREDKTIFCLMTKCAEQTFENIIKAITLVYVCYVRVVSSSSSSS